MNLNFNKETGEVIDKELLLDESRIIESMRNYGCVHVGGNKYMFTHYDEIIDACSRVFKMDLNKKYRTRRVCGIY